MTMTIMNIVTSYKLNHSSIIQKYENFFKEKVDLL
jgi:hypothetical protein